MKSITLQISEEELLEVISAYQTLQNFLEKIVSPNEIYQSEFLDGLRQAQAEVQNKEFVEVKSFADFVQ
ncbi:MAG TPA: hypothetical protein VGD05_01865 [Pyrinomonadaceae bacterium]|jgi:hypothetical protein